MIPGFMLSSRTDKLGTVNTTLCYELISNFVCLFFGFLHLATSSSPVHSLRTKPLA